MTNITEGLQTCQVEDNNTAIGVAIVASCERTEPFLACSVPNVKINFLAILKINSACFGINGCGGSPLCCVCIRECVCLMKDGTGLLQDYRQHVSYF